jgi:hypothetical protein
MQHSLKWIAISLISLSQIGCVPSGHDLPTASAHSGTQTWSAARGFVEYRGAPAMKRSSDDEKIQWHLTLTCSQTSVGVEIEAPSEHIMPVLLPGDLGRRANVSYRFGNDNPVTGLWQIDLQKRAVFLEGEDAERFMSLMAENNRLAVQVNYTHRNFNILGTGEVLHKMRGNCRLMDEASVTLTSQPAS